MKSDSLRSSLIGSVFVVASALLLGSCGGGGASNSGPIGGPPQILPSGGTFYAGVEYTFTIAGGRPPYNLASSEPSLLSVPTTLNGNFFTVIPNNTGVVDTGLPPEALPVRTVNITMRDAIGNTAGTSGLQVAQNFLTGYGVSYLSNCSTAGGTGTPPAACSGGETAVELSATINGNLVGNRQYRFEILRGQFSWIFTPGGAIAGNTITSTTDHEGDAHVLFRVNNNVATQIAVFRVVDVATGTSTTHLFTIDGVDVGGTLEVIPESFSFTGANSAQCGTGSGDFLVFDGTPPYTAVSSNANVTVTGDTPNTTPARSTTQPGRFTITATNPFVCLADVAVVVTDANNSRATVTVTTEAGSADPPPAPISVTPGSLTLACGTSGSVSVIGGATGTAGSTFSVSSSDPRITAAITGRTLTAGRTNTDPPGTPPSPTPGTPNPMSFVVTVTDGASSTTLGITAPSNCPP